MPISMKRLTASAAAGALLVVAVACADRTTEPVPARSASPLLAPTGGINYALGGRELDKIQVMYMDQDTVTFTIDPKVGGTFNLAQGHFVYFPARAVCDPATSTYGPTHWDEPCVPATKPITVTAVSMRTIDGAPFVSFEPALRFVPTKGDKGFVYLYMHDDDYLRWMKMEIDYCFDGLACVDESALDPTLHTQKTTARYKYLFRRIKHFSGYNVAAGRTDDSSNLY